ncbi:MAG: hypothetical protein ACO1OB_28715 [Archangium sp.]
MKRRDELLRTVEKLRAERDAREAEVSAAVGALRARRDELLAKVTRAETEVDDLAEQVELLQQELDDALREEQAARSHLRSVR